MNSSQRVLSRVSFGVFTAILVVGAVLGSMHYADAFSIRGAFRNDAQFVSVLFDANVASSTATSSVVTFNSGTPSVGMVFTGSENPKAIFISATGTVNIGDTITIATSTLTDVTNATNTTEGPQKILPPIKIAGVRGGSSGNSLDEYVMLYNQMNSAYAASGTLVLHVLRGASDVAIPLSFATTSIPDHGFFLITSASGYSGSVSPDATYSTSSDLIASSTTAIYISTTTAARVNIIDKVEWGASPQITTSTNATSTFAATTATTTLVNGTTLVRKASASSVAGTVMSGGAEANKGNGYDTRDNADDFILLSLGQTAATKNSQSPKEFPMGGGGQSDTSAPVVMGSFPSGAGGEMIPTDLGFIGFGFSKPVDATTVGTSTVSLVVQGTGANLCATVSYNNMSTNGPPGQCTIAAGTLVAGTTYVFTISGSSSTPKVQDFSGNALSQPAGSGMGQHGNANHGYELTFTPTSGFVRTPTVPPSVLGTSPSAGSSGIPTNATKVVVTFSQAMDITSFGGVTLATAAGGANILTNASAVLLTDGKSVSIPIASALTAGAEYRITVPATVKNSNGMYLPGSYVAPFTAGSGADATGPQVLGRLPNVATGVPVNAIDIHAAADDALDASTITSSTVQVADAGGNVIPGTVSYDPLAREILWVGNNMFQPATAYAVTLNALGTTPNIKNVAGVALQDNDGTANSLYRFTFTTGAADVTGPGVLFANANGFSAAVTFDEPVKKTEAENIANYALSSGGSVVTLSSFNGNTATYDSARKTVTINNITLTAGATFAVTVSGVHDLSNNSIDATKTSFSGTVQASTMNGGNIGVGGGYTATTSSVPTGFSDSMFGFVPQPEVRPSNTLAGFSSSYSVGIPISKQIPASGKILMTFPSSFTLAGAVADSFSPANADINGPGTGAVTIAGVAGNDTSHTVTVTLGAVATQNKSGDVHDFLRFDLSGIMNSPVPNSSNGYTVDIRTVSGTSTLESVTSRPFFITAGGSGNMFTISVAASGATNGTSTIYVFSPQTGPLSSSTTAFSGGNATTTFVNVPNGTYNLMTDPIVNLTGGTFLGQATPLPVTVNGSTTASLTLTASGALASSTVNIHATAAGKKISVFAGGPQGYVDVATSTVNGTTTVVVYYSSAGNYNVGVGPQINKMFQGPPPSPEYVMPQPVQVNVASGLASRTTINFDLVSAANTITGTVVDGSSKAVASAGVFAYSPQGGFGTFGQSGSDGSYRLSVSPGSYKIGANAPGFPSSQEMSVLVDSAGSLFVNGASASSSAVTIKMSKPTTSIGGSVTDGTNAIQGAQVWAYCDPGTAGNACFGPNGHAEAQTDSSGAYTLYVGNGTWKVAAYIPGYGQQPEASVTISGASATSQNFQPSATGTFKSVAGTVCTNTGADCSGGTGVSGAMVRIEGTDASGRFYTNSAISGSDGTYSFASIPSGAGSSYRVRGFAPTLGELPATAAFTVTANVASKDLVVGAGRTININIGNAPSAFEVFMKFTNITTGVANFFRVQNNTSGTVQVSDSATYNIDVQSPGFDLAATDIAKTAGTLATYTTSTGRLVLTAGGGSAVTLSLAFPASTAISGTVKDGSDALVGNAWVDVSNSSNGMHFGTQANASGTYSLAVSDGSYTISAFSPGYVPSPKSLTLSGSTITFGTATTTADAVNLTVSKTSLTIGGTVTVNGSAASGAFVKGTSLGGGTTVVVAGTDGVYSLPVIAGVWTITAAADGYQAANYGSTVTVGAASVTGISVNLTTAVTLAAPTAQPITPSQGGNMRNNSGTLEVTVPANALGSSANSGQIKATETNSMGQTATARPIGKGQDIKAYDSSNNSITTLNDNVTISLDVASTDFSANGITSTSTAEKMKLGYFDTSIGDWVPIASAVSYENSSGVQVAPDATLSNVDHITVTGSVDHFSTFGIITTSESLAPSAPSGVSATVTSRTIVVSWTAPTTNTDASSLTDLMEFEIYRDTSASGDFTTQVNTSQVASGTLSFTDPNPSAGTTYYYKVTAADTSANESSKSSATDGVVIPTATVGTGGSTAGGGGGGGGGGSTTPAVTTTQATTTATAATTTATTAAPVWRPQVVAPTAVGASSVSASAGGLTITLSQGSENSQVTYLQELLSQDSEIYPEQKVTGYFGPATKRAVQRFQKKYGIVSSGSSYGLVGPQTRAKLMEVLGGGTASAPSAPAAALQTGPISAGGQLTKVLSQGVTDSQVTYLQELLSQDSELYPEGLVTGYFGPATKRAVQRFQKKYGIVSSGSSYGLVGPQTRAKLMEVLGGGAPAAAPSAGSVPVKSPAETLKALQEQLRVLQEQLKKLQ